MNNNRVEQNPAFKNLFLFFEVLGIVLFVICTYLNEVVVGILFWCLFGGISLLVLISYHTCWITYDERGFVRSNFIGIRKTYSWSDVTGLGKFENQVMFEVNNCKMIRLNETWINKDEFVSAIRKYGRNVRRIEIPVRVYGAMDIVKSYEYGVFRKALIVERKNLGEHDKYKVIHYVLCGGMFIVLVVGSRYFLHPEVLLLCEVIINIIIVIGMILYYTKPQHFTVIEKPRSTLGAKTKNHKIVTLPILCMADVLYNVYYVMILAAYQGSHVVHVNTTVLGFSICILAVLLFFNIIIFKAKSWEYRNYHIGFGDFLFYLIFHYLSFLLFSLV